VLKYIDIQVLPDKDLWNLHDMCNYELDRRDETRQDHCTCPNLDSGGDCEHCQSYYAAFNNG
jgi:hypothetical protein